MKRYRFEIQKCINVEVDAETVEEARAGVIDNLAIYADEMIVDPYVSEGVEL